MKRTKTVALLLLAGLALHGHAQSWKQAADSARIYQQQRDNGKATALFTKAHEELKKDSAGTLTYFQIANETGDFFWATGKYADAEPFYLDAKATIEKIQGKENANYGLITMNLGRLYRLLGQYPKSEPLLIESRTVREKVLGKETAEFAASTNNLAILYAETGRYDEAGPLYKEALQLRRKVFGTNHIDYATSCNNLAIYYVLTGKPSAAEMLYIEAKDIRERLLGKEHPFYAASCNNLGALYLDMGQYSKAEPLYIEARQVREKMLGKEHPDYASSCDNLAILYMDIGNYEQAEALYKEARGIREKALGTKHIEYAKGCNNLALLYKILGQYDKAAALFIEAKEIFAEAVGKEHFEYGKCCNNLGAVYMDMNDYAKAAPLYTEAREVWAKSLGKEHPEYAKGTHNLALLELNKGNTTEAIALFTEANRIYEKSLGKDHVNYAESCDNLATTYAMVWEYDKAIDLYKEAKDIRQRIVGAEHPDYLQSCINMANAYRSSGNREAALNYYTEAFSTQQILLNKVFRFTTEPEKQAYLKKINEYRSYFLSFSTEAPNDKSAVYAYEASLANKNLILNESQRLRAVITSTKDTSLVSRYNKWISMREQLAFMYARPAADKKAEQTQLEEDANKLERELIRLSFPFREEHAERSWKDVQQSLKTGEAAIEFSSFQFHNAQVWQDSIYYIAVVIRKDRPAPELVKLFEKKQFAALVGNKTPGQQMLNVLYTYSNKPGTSLYNLIWKPLEGSLTGINTIYFSPAGDLYKISFAALPLSNTQVLGDKYRLVQLNSTAALADTTGSSIAANDKLILYGGIQYEADSVRIRRAVLSSVTNDMAKRSVPVDLLRSSIGDFYYLEQTEREVNEIAKMAKTKKFDVVVSSGITATEESLKALSGDRSPGILHIATHGFFFADPYLDAKEVRKTGRSPFQVSDNPLIRSGLALAGANNAWRRKPITGVEDGILTAYEVSNMYLPATKLAVLSACETGLGDIQGSEGVYGLQRAFKMAGAENLVMSLWKVPDTESAEFMQEFYRNLFAGQSIHLAFYNAQTMMKNKYRSIPFKWAAWVLVR
ncbi:MAG TPA: CHAT domain-containing tetratricopeptide repeat protein [Chitinophagaceae bacterium]|nr:CHAT domain-containing tetratricopeptide repeat protein [Chitinophagaceae bacterium]